MGGQQQVIFPPDDRLVELARQHGSRAAIGREEGISDSTLKHHILRTPGLHQRVQDAINEYRAEKQQSKAGAVKLAGADEQVTREEMLDAQVIELEGKLRTYRRGSVLDELALERFTAAFGRAKPRYNPLTVPKRHRSKEEHEHILLFSDAHANEVVSLEETGGLNSYDWNIMLRRMARIQKSVLSFQDNRPYPIKKLHVWMGGDNVSGDIHDELSETNELPHEESVVQFALDTSEWLQEFGPHYEKIAVSGVPGNHPRRAKKPTAKMAFNNSDWTYYQFLKARLESNDQFSFNFAKAKFTEVMVAERWRALLLHGDGIRSTMVDVPWGGIVRYLGKLARQYVAMGKPIDIFGLGHWHTANAIEAGGPDVKTIINGTLKGVDEYSLQRFGGGGSPQQLLLTVHPRRGVTDISYLNCEDPVPASERLQAA